MALDLTLRSVPSNANPHDIRLYNPSGGGGGFPYTQYQGLRVYYGAAVVELCLVAQADANTGMGAAPMVRKGGTTYAVYLVDTTDPDASSVRVRTTTGTRAIRKYTT